MPRITQQHEQQVRQRIAAAALRVFGEHGFHRATIQDVVRESGLSVGAIYTYYKSKDELFLSICDMTVEETVMSLAAESSAGSDDDELWRRLSAGGRRLVSETLGTDACDAALERIVASLRSRRAA